MRAVVIGASVAGLTTVEVLRTEGFQGAITLVGSEAHLPYDRPPLSKSILQGKLEPVDLTLGSKERIAELGVDLRLSTRAVGLDVARRCVALDDGSTLPYDRLVISTGVTPRPMDHLGIDPEVLQLRSVEDALRIRAAAATARHVLIIGSGFLGTEIAASLAFSGSRVTLIDPAPGPMARVFGNAISAEILRLHREHGVDIRAGVSVLRTARHTSGHLITFTDGTEVVADCVIAAVGATPAVDWLRSSGLDLGNGVVCDLTCRAAPDVYAAGDVAAWPTDDGGIVRVEHRTNATEQAITVAENLMGAEVAYRPVPYFWTDQYDCKIQSYGLFHGDDSQHILSGNIAERRFVVAFGRNDHVVGVVGCNAPRDVVRARRLVAERAPWQDILSAETDP